jgi:hypothetical protein
MKSWTPLGLLGVFLVLSNCSSNEQDALPPGMGGGGSTSKPAGDGDGDTAEDGHGDGDQAGDGDGDQIGGGAGSQGTEKNPPRPSGPNIVFVSSELVQPAELGGLRGADELCQELADDAGLSGTYVAWLSDSEHSAEERLGDARGWVRTDGRPVADTRKQLSNSELFYPIHLDEQGNRVHSSPTEGVVLTGSLPDGSADAGEESDFCADWTDDSGWGAVVGSTDHGGPSWSSRGPYTFAQESCKASLHLYCFGIDAAEPLQVDFEDTRVAFVTADSPETNMGIAHFDQVCQSEAEEAGLAGTYLALLPTVGQSAASRFDLAGLPWGRTDGVPLMEQASDLTSSTLLAPINHLADGSLLEPYGWVAVGAPTPGTPGVVGDPTNNEAGTCNDWSAYVLGSGSLEYARGFAHRSDPGWWDYGLQGGCNTWTRVYCLEE